MAMLLDDISVLDLSMGPAGGVTTMILGDFGARATKVEPPGGDPFRKMPSSRAWIRGKKSVELDLDDASAVKKLHGLVAGADVVVSSQRTCDAREQGCDYATLSRINAKLVYCQITGFGDEGPSAALPPYEGVVAAKAGRMKSFEGITPIPGPAYSAVPVATHAAIQNAVSGILAALIERRRSGAGQMVKTTLLQGLMPYDIERSIRVQLMERNPPAPPPPGYKYDPSKAMPELNYHPVQAGDGRWMQLANLMAHHYERYLRITGLDKVREEPPYDEPEGTWSLETKEAYREIMLRRMQERRSDEWLEEFIEDGGVACQPYMTAEEALDDPDILTNGHAITLDDIRQLGPLARLSETPAQIQTPAPEPGQHNDLLDSVDPLTPNGTPEPTADAGPPLAGITILEFAGVLATPMGCSFLVDLGARVIKVEPLEGDPFRTITGESGASRVNNGKDSVTVNLKTEEGKAIVVELIKRADMIIHNYRPGVPEKLGIGYDDAKKINPGIVYLSANGYGPLGPSAMRPSAHPIPGAALGGAMYQAGGVSNTKLLDVAGLRETSRKLMRANEVNPDPNTGMVVCSAALLGLYGKRRSGIGQRVFIDMLGANAYANFDEFIQYEGKPTRPPLDSELRGPTPLYRLYRCKEGWIFLGLLLDREWEEFCRAIEREDLLQDPNFASEEMREDNRTLLSSKLADLFSAKTAVEWESLVGTRGLGCVAANNETPPEYFLKDAHVRENNWMVPANHALWGDYLRHAPMVEFSRSSCPVSGGVLAGQQTDAVMGELGFSSSDIVSLRDKNVLGPTVDAQRNHYQIL